MTRFVRLMLLVALAGCGRTSLLPDGCLIAYAPQSLDFGEISPGASQSGVVNVENHGGELCRISNLALSSDSSADFSIPNPLPFYILPTTSEPIEVVFAPRAATLPLGRTGTLLFDSNDLGNPAVQVPLTARVHTNCKITVEPAAVDFGHVALGDSIARTVTVTDVGTDSCEIASIAIGSGSDSEFSVAAGQALTFTLIPGASAQIGVGFSATDPAPPHHRTGTLVFQSSDPNNAGVSVPLSADIDIGCDLTITPPSLDFGNVILNTSATASVTLGNDGSSPCNVSAIALGAATDPGFTLAPGQPTQLTVAPGASQAIPITFSAFDSDPPHLKTGTLIFQTGNTRMPNATVPLSAFVNTVCVEASQWIYTVDQNSMFSRFDPATLTFTDIGTLACPGGGSPFSMAVDQNAVAWVEYSDGRLYQVDTGTAVCTATSFVPNQDGLLTFGMGFVFEPTTGLDTLYIAGASNTFATTSTLATVSFPGLGVAPVGSTEGLPELTGTGDGTLWGFFPAGTSVDNLASLTQIDPASGATLAKFTYPALTGGSAWAMKFWGGSFWIFLDQSIYKVDRNTPKIAVTAIANTGRTIVGAGVSTCAPLH